MSLELTKTVLGNLLDVVYCNLLRSSLMNKILAMTLESLEVDTTQSIEELLLDLPVEGK